MATDYYKRKVFTRAEGILRTCVIPEYKYAWSEDGNALAFFIPLSIGYEALQKAVQYMECAFRKAKANIGPEMGVDTVRPIRQNRWRTIIVRFEKDAIIQQGDSNDGK